MKRFITILLAAALTLSLTACDKADNNPESSSEGSSAQNGSSTEQSTTAEENEPIENTGLTELTSTVRFTISPSCGTETGMYYMDSLSLGKGNGYLMYIDYATKQEVYVCADSSCKHDSDRCTSFFSRDEFFTRDNSCMFSYGGSLYYLSLPNYSEGGVGTRPAINDDEERDQALYRMNLDGSNRERVFTFDKDIAVDSFVAGDGNDLWFYVRTPFIEYNEKTKMYYSNSKDKAMIRLSLSDRTIVERIPLKNNDRLDCYRVLGCVGDKFIFSVDDYPEGITIKNIFEIRTDVAPGPEFIISDPRLEEIRQKTDEVNFTLDAKTKETKEIFRYNRVDGYGYRHYFSGDIMYICDYEDDSAVEVNMLTGEQTASEHFSPKDDYRVRGMLDGRFVFSPFVEGDEPKDGPIYFSDPSTGEITKTELHSPAWQDRPIVESVVTFGGGYVLILGEEISIENKHFGVGGFYYEYYVMTTDDFFNGVDNLMPVKVNERENTI